MSLLHLFVEHSQYLTFDYDHQNTIINLLNFIINRSNYSIYLDDVENERKIIIDKEEIQEFTRS